MAGLCLKWAHYETTMLETFRQMLLEKEMLDVTIACEGKSLDAHKLVLSGCSDFFKELFKNNPCKHPIVILKDVEFADLTSLIDFMYNGSVTVSNEQLPSLLKTAETLSIKELAKMTTRPSYEAAKNLMRSRNKRKRQRKSRSGFSANSSGAGDAPSDSETEAPEQKHIHQQIIEAQEAAGDGVDIIYTEVLVQDGMDPNAAADATRILELSMQNAEVVEGSEYNSQVVEEMGTGDETGVDNDGGEKESADESIEGSNQFDMLASLISVDSDNQLMLLRKKQSFVWEYFTETGKGSVKCRKCSKLLSYKDSSGSTSNMIKHLKTVHSVERAPRPPLQE